MNSTSNLTNTQELVIATEVSLAKNYAIKSNNLANETNSELNILKNEVSNIQNKLNNVILKLENLTTILSNAQLPNVNKEDLKYINL